MDVNPTELDLSNWISWRHLPYLPKIQCEELQTQLKPWGPELLNQLFFCRVWLQAQFSSQKKFWLMTNQTNQTNHVSGVEKSQCFRFARFPNAWSHSRNPEFPGPCSDYPIDDSRTQQQQKAAKACPSRHNGDWTPWTPCIFWQSSFRWNISSVALKETEEFLSPTFFWVLASLSLGDVGPCSKLNEQIVRIVSHQTPPHDFWRL